MVIMTWYWHAIQYHQIVFDSIGHMLGVIKRKKKIKYGEKKLEKKENIIPEWRRKEIKYIIIKIKEKLQQNSVVFWQFHLKQDIFISCYSLKLICYIISLELK